MLFRSLAALLACADPPPPTMPDPLPIGPATPTTWSRVARVSTEGIDVPALPQALLGPGCATLNAALGGDGPPCFVEDWSGPRMIRVERAGATVRLDGDRVQGRWPNIGTLLDGCLGDPLALPPAADPGGARTLTDDTWILTFSGQNLCVLGGSLKLALRGGRVDTSALTVEGLAWSRGGRERAANGHRARLRAVVRDDWETLSATERDDALRALARDPDPEAQALLAKRQRSTSRVR